MHDDAPEDTFLRATAAAMRALAESPTLDVTCGAPAPRLDGSHADLPAPRPGAGTEPHAWLRGHADRLALGARHHDATVHAALRPRAEPAGTIYDRLEQARVETLGARDLEGVADNLHGLLESQYREQGLAGAQGRADVPIAEGIACLAREALGAPGLPPTAALAAELWRATLATRHAPAFAALARAAVDQPAYAAAARGLLRDLGLDEEAATPAPDDSSPDGERPPGDDAGEPQTEAGDSRPETTTAAQAALAAERAADDERTDAPADAESRVPAADASGPPGSAYRAFTTEFDRVAGAADLADAAELQRLRARLDSQLLPLRALTARLANRLLRRLQARQTRSWRYDEEEGRLDAGRLVRVVTNPLHPLAFKQEIETRHMDTTVTLLVDNSGSMRGRPITIAAMVTDILARTLERCGVQVEILGFTTSAWKGGYSRQAWLDAGQPPGPGRLNDLLHIVYKPAEVPWRRARNNIALMLKDDLPKQNVDGEALLWACGRLLARPQRRRLLIVLSDGAPVDDSTLSLNGRHYLEAHLREVIAWIERDLPLELVGIGHQVSRYYARAVELARLDELAVALVDELTRLLDTPPRRRRVPASVQAAARRLRA